MWPCPPSQQENWLALQECSHVVTHFSILLVYCHMTIKSQADCIVVDIWNIPKNTFLQWWLSRKTILDMTLNGLVRQISAKLFIHFLKISLVLIPSFPFSTSFEYYVVSCFCALELCFHLHFVNPIYLGLNKCFWIFCFLRRHELGFRDLNYHILFVTPLNISCNWVICKLIWVVLVGRCQSIWWRQRDDLCLEFFGKSADLLLQSAACCLFAWISLGSHSLRDLQFQVLWSTG